MFAGEAIVSTPLRWRKERNSVLSSIKGYGYERNGGSSGGGGGGSGRGFFLQQSIYLDFFYIKEKFFFLIRSIAIGLLW